MSLVNLKKKNIKIFGDYPNGYWYKEQYDNKGNIIYSEEFDGSWDKWKYDDNGNTVYYENSLGEISVMNNRK